MHKTYTRLLIISLMLILAILTPAQEPVRISAPAATCADIPNPVTTPQELTDAINAANDETLCPGADIIDLGGNVLAMSDIVLPSVMTDVTLQNGILTPQQRFIYYELPVAIQGKLTLENMQLKYDSFIANAGTLIISNTTVEGDGMRISTSGETYIQHSSILNTGKSLGSLDFEDGDLYIYDSVLQDNLAFAHREFHDILFSAKSLVMYNSYVVGNGGLYIFDVEEALVVNSIFYRNYTDHNSFSGNIISGTTKAYNNVFVDNKNIEFTGSGSTIVNNIATYDGDAPWPFGKSTVRYNALDFTVPNGSNNIMLPTNPFRDNIGSSVDFPPPETFRLALDSPLIDAGSTFDLPPDTIDMDDDGNITEPIPFDFAGDARVQGAAVDIGAYEAPPNLIQNATFSRGLDSWGFYGQGEVFVENEGAHFYRNPGFKGASLFQQVDAAFDAGDKIELRVKVGNLSDQPKSVNILVRSEDFRETISCAVTIPTLDEEFVTLRDVIDQSWSSGVVSILAYDPDGLPSIRVDDVELLNSPDADFSDYTCEGFSPPTETNLLQNGNFSQGLPYWTLFGDFDFTINNGAMTFWRTSGATRPAVLFQNQIGHHLFANTPLQLYAQVGNSSTSAKTVQVIVRDVDWKQAFICEYTLPANTPLTYIRVQGTTHTEWARPMVLVRALEGTGEAGILVDNFTLRYRPDLDTTNQCGNPSFSSAADPVVPDGMKAPTTILPDSGTLPDAGDNAAPASVAPPNPGGIPEIPGF